jgi:DNA-binding NarL/FixJ family response regulator
MHPLGGLATFTRRSFQRDVAWRRSEFFNEYVRRGHIDDMILAVYDAGQGVSHGLLLHRALGEKAFGLRERRMLSLFFAEQSQLHGARLAPRDALSVLAFPPRLQQVLWSLMNGSGEKQIAAALAISQHTVHYHVKELYRRFGAANRGELVARARPYWQALEICPRPARP